MGALVGAMFTIPAYAQEADVASPESLVERAEPLGVRAGRFQIYPRITADARYDSNIYNRPSLETEDVLAVVRPAVSIRPDLARHDLRLDLAGEVRRYMDTPAENSEQFVARLAGRADLRDRTVANARVQVARRIERRGTAGDAFLTDEPVSYLETEAAVGVGRSGGRLELSGEFVARETDYDDATVGGVPADQSFRNALRLRVGIRGGYRIGPQISAFAQVSANDLDYRHEPSGPRGSSGYSVLAGLRFDLGDLASGEAAVGYLRQDFANPEEEDYDGFDFRLAARWIPTPRLQLAAEGTRSIEQSPLPQVSAVVESSIRLSGLYALGSRVLTGLELGYESEHYPGIDRSARRYFGEASLQYQIAPQFAGFAAGGYRHQEGSGGGARDYSGATVRIGIRWTP